MPFLRCKPNGTRPTDAQVRAAAAAVNRGDIAAADKVCEDAGDYRQETVMRIFRYIDVEAP
ncbi:hypothetical protein [Streptomyces sp. WM6349]|uniref:hypothetical protein n=1 Tax=Streptomyces sp. WM6349 TaxID=1415552 RepID=UPI0006AEA9B3|nr:hypothetical protein [Streptomyces sp. WM6349]KOU17035.1 hypothetical protein ADK49_16990 [Streptomyces sp. WM6349]